MSDSTTSRRQFLLAGVPAAAIGAALPATLLLEPAATVEDLDQAADVADACSNRGWRADTHPWAREYLIGLWRALEACEEAFDRAPHCQCNACADMHSAWRVLEMFASCVDCEHFAGSGFPERVLHIAGVTSPAELPSGFYRRWYAEEQTAARK